MNISFNCECGQSEMTSSKPGNPASSRAGIAPMDRIITVAAAQWVGVSIFQFLPEHIRLRQLLLRARFCHWERTAGHSSVPSGKYAARERRGLGSHAERRAWEPG